MKISNTAAKHITDFFINSGTISNDDRASYIYCFEYAIDTIKILRQRDLLKASTILVVETDREDVIKEIEQLDNISIFDIRKYGRASIIFARMTN